ncbi:SDR family oxidoreductase [Actinocrispum wychmicini]|uniref:Uncharacterized protein YbjT (DUF2867 family) n=1 Tax=Actinocrispum wychmicini TaxID=1213861 RepID=A0A4R2KH30_9PSEU|nr:NAD(P)H-binding protein [Actinocrispum wychmicini]TCO65745.1 uncharacterized protein YbjT (DUF2867 family) [Actinocrispum wychmicini]
MTILVTGATGKVGRQAVAQLVAQGAEVRALVRTPATARLPDGVDVVAGDLTDVDSVRAAATGADKVFLVWPFFTVDTLPAVLEVLPRRVVYLSSEGGAKWADDAEALIRAAGLQWTFLRPTGFAGNLLEFAAEIKTSGVVRAPFAKLARPYIHEYDMAAVGVRALTEDGHVGRSYSLSGPELVTQLDAVQTIGDVIGRALRFEELTPEQGKQRMRDAGWPPTLLTAAFDGWAGMVAEPEPITSTVADVTGRPAKSVREWAIDNAASFTV